MQTPTEGGPEGSILTLAEKVKGNGKIFLVKQADLDTA